MADELERAIAQIIEPLAEFEQSNTLAWLWRYRWKSWAEGARWHAEVQAGYADDQWRIAGACPRWGGSGDDEAAALAEAVRSAVHFWVIGPQGASA